MAYSERLLTLKCVGECDDFQVPLIVLWPKGTAEEEKIEFVKTWRAGDLRCPYGHAIGWPFGWGTI
jgi:hypothetical protein